MGDPGRVVKEVTAPTNLDLRKQDWDGDKNMSHPPVGGNATIQGPAWNWSASIWPVVCGFLNLCRKNFTLLVQVIFRVCILNLGTVTQEKDLR